MLDGQAILLDFDTNASLKALAGEYKDKINYVPGNAKDQLGLNALLIRPDGIVAWACDSEPDHDAVQKAAARWFAW